MDCSNITTAMCLTWWMQLEENHSSHGYTSTHYWRPDNVIMSIISGFIQLQKRNRFLPLFSCLLYITISSLVISSCIYFSFSFSSVCGGGQEKRRHRRCMPDSLLDSFVLLLSLGHADITCSPTVHPYYPLAPLSLCLDPNHPLPICLKPCAPSKPSSHFIDKS